MFSLQKILATTLVLSVTTASAASGTVISTGTGDAPSAIKATASGATAPVSAPTEKAAPTSSLDLTNPPRLVSKTDSSITIAWDKVPNAKGYIVKYSTTSVMTSSNPDAQYDNESDQVIGTGTTITKLTTTGEKLSPNTKYYFSVVAVDSKGNESDNLSNEIEVITNATAATFGLASNPKVIDSQTISIEFTAPLAKDGKVTVKMKKQSDSSDVMVSSVTPDLSTPSRALVKLSAKLDPSSAYELTVLSAKDAVGNSIEQWVNGTKEFTTPDTLPHPVMTAAPPAAATGAVAPQPVVAAPAVTGSGAVAVAKLPNTGANENIMIIVALLLSVGIVVIARRKAV